MIGLLFGKIFTLVNIARELSGRWFSYLYEVIIFQWVELLVKQTKRGEQVPSDLLVTSKSQI